MGRAPTPRIANQYDIERLSELFMCMHVNIRKTAVIDSQSVSLFLLVLKGLDEGFEGGDEKVRPVAHFFADGNAAVPDEDVGAARDARLEVGGAVAHHRERLVPKLSLEKLDGARLAARGGGELLGVKAAVRPLLAPARRLHRLEEDVVGVDDVGREPERGGDGADHLPEPARHEVHLLAARLERRHELRDAGAQLGRVVRHVRLHRLEARLHDAEPGRQRLLERDAAAHSLGGPRRHLLALAQIRRQLVDPLVRAHRAVHVEAHSVHRRERRQHLRLLRGRRRRRRGASGGARRHPRRPPRLPPPTAAPTPHHARRPHHTNPFGLLLFCSPFLMSLACSQPFSTRNGAGCRARAADESP
mmetsp:Transcript_24092/g.78472  ORF Transcript_24092/g.78472 Transcript_24092/m.78472 type:complete len:360 (+) Transcript_24092:453-1532(+)